MSSSLAQLRRLAATPVVMAWLGCAGAAPPDDEAATFVGGIAPAGTSDATGVGSDDEGTTVSPDFDDDLPWPSTTGSSFDTDDGGDTTGRPPAAGGVCTAVGSDAPCTACAKDNCCPQLMTCSADPGCSCYMTCVATRADVFGCAVQCGVDLFAPGPTGELVSCSAGACMGTCA